MSRVKDNFPDFQSGFDNSPFYLAPVSENKIEYSETFNDILNPKELISVTWNYLKIYPLNIAPPEKACNIDTKSSMSSVIILNAESDAKYNIGGRVSDLADKLHFSSKDFGQLYCVTLGKSLVYSISMSKTPIKDNLDHIVNNYLAWLFKGDEEAKSFYFKKFRNAVEEFYNGFLAYDNLSDWEKALIYLAEIFIELIEVIKTALGKFLVWIADGIRELKITDEKKWKPIYNENNQEVYKPLFIPNIDLGIDFSSLENKYKEIDSTIIELINKFDWVQKDISSEISANSCQTYMITLTQDFYSSVRDILVSVYSTLKNIYIGYVEYSRLLNAFLVGLYNGIIEMVAGIIELIGNLVQTEKLKEIIDGFKEVVAKIKENGVIQFLKDIFNEFIKKYQDAESSYDIAKFLGEDLAEIILDIIVGIISAGGAVPYIAGKKASILALKKLPDALKKTKDLLSDPKKLKNKIEERLKNRKSKKTTIDLNPRCFKHLTEEQKAAYIKQKEYLEGIKSETDFQKGTRKNSDIERKTLHNTKGNWGEMKTDQFFLNLDQRWKPLHKMTDNWNNPIDKGIDGIFQNLDFIEPPPPPEFVIVESKAFGASLNTKKTKSGYQMDSDWIDVNLELLILDRKIRRKIRKKAQPLLFTWKSVDSNPLIQLLDNNAKIILELDKSKFINN